MIEKLMTLLVGILLALAGWSLSSCKEGKLSVCSEKCGVEFDPYKAQWSDE